MFLVTIDLVPMIELSPIVTPLRMFTPLESAYNRFRLIIVILGYI